MSAAKAVNYEGAGTVEFIWDCDSDQFYFMEMNTRLQVEHPVSEMITGVDLVQWQIEAASGIQLSVTQADILKNGNAIEARVYAENTENNFMPDVGKLKLLQTPEPNENVRIEMALRQGDEITVFYDPMIAKVIAFGKDRSEAIRRLSKALSQFRVIGVRTNIEFIQKVLSLEMFKYGAVDTGFISANEGALFEAQKLKENDYAMMGIFALRSKTRKQIPEQSTYYGLFSIKIYQCRLL